MRIFALVLIAGALAAVGLRGAGCPGRAHDQARVETAFYRAVARGEGQDALMAEIEAHVARFGGDAEARWFAARLYLKLREVDRAVESVFGNPVFGNPVGAASRRTDRRFGDLVLRVVGFDDDRRLARPTKSAPRALLALVDGRVPAAVDATERTARETATQAVLTFFDGLFAFTTRATNERVAAGLRQRGIEQTKVAAALVALGPDPYPQREADVTELIGIATGPMRRREPLVWILACLALGRSEHPDAVAALESLVAELEGQRGEGAKTDLALASAGLLAAGRWEAADGVAPLLGPLAARTPIRHWYGEALLWRIAREDPQALRYVVGLWTSLKTHPEPLGLARLAQGLFLRGLDLPAELDTDALLTDLEGEEWGPAEHAVAAAARYTRGEADARVRLLETLRASARAGWVDQDPIQSTAFIPSPILIASRALLLGDPAARP